MNQLQNTYLKIGIGVFVSLLVGVGLFWGLQSEQKQAALAGSIEVVEPMYSFGDIPITGGNVSHSYKIRNSGNGPVNIKGMVTSCMCTTAVINYADGTSSPRFSMHNNPVFYSREMAPGEEATVVTIFDPMFHGPDGIGNITRDIMIDTNAGRQNLRFTGNVIR